MNGLILNSIHVETLDPQIPGYVEPYITSSYSIVGLCYFGSVTALLHVNLSLFYLL